MKKIKLILRLARLHFLLLGFLLYLLGYLLAIQVGSQHNLAKFLFGYLIFGSAHLSVSFSNDYFDQQTDKKSLQTPFSGGSKVLVNYPELQKIALNLAIALLLTSAVTSIIFTITYNYTLWFTIFVTFGGLLGYFYTANPIKLAYRGLGEIATMIGVGIFMTGMGYFVAQGQLNTLFFLFFMPLSFYGLFFIVTVELPDIKCDTFANKKTLVVKIGQKNGKIISFLATLTATIYFSIISYLKIANGIIDWAPFIIFSALPLLASIFSVLTKTNNQKSLTKQVMLNIISLTVFVILLITSLLLKNI
ncbi:MAG: prenyltransferase [Candidatus Bathyarchaeota archaeon]|nr:prenyltransferase [Candidatus Bathyarchaeum tardum]WGM90274.1 MAG: prenyltransferase [Candidatus Bathyarchaeum tardum]